MRTRLRRDEAIRRQKSNSTFFQDQNGEWESALGWEGWKGFGQLISPDTSVLAARLIQLIDLTDCVASAREGARPVPMTGQERDA